jgi:exopolyphosphatase
MTSTSLARWLHLAREAVFSKSTEKPLTIVLGNTSADLDSFISAVVFAYFHNRKLSSTDRRIYVPLLNLADVPSSDLWRLRPEYGTALRLAARGPDFKEDKDVEKSLLRDLITIADIRSDATSALHSTFVTNTGDDAQNTHKQDTVLVDHNAPQIPGLSSIDITSRLNITGVIDHHLDEDTIPASADPRIVKTGIGSCTSLVVQHLRDISLWPPLSSKSDSTAENHATPALLALAPILIDTADLTATGDKISPVDHASVAFLESHIRPTYPDFDRTAFYNEIHTAKSNKLQLLSLPEILESDYKAWNETPSSTSASQNLEINIGIASLVQDLPWLVRHAGSSSKLVESMTSFAKQPENNLSLLALITKGNAPDGTFRKELAIVAWGESAMKALEIFERDATEELKLKAWGEDEEFLNALGSVPQTLDQSENGNGEVKYKVWWQGDVSKSRKQVAPLLREAVRKA